MMEDSTSIDDVFGFRKRVRDEASATEPLVANETEKKSNRGNYRCNRCNTPKKGHICPYEARLKIRDVQKVSGESDFQKLEELNHCPDVSSRPTSANYTPRSDDGISFVPTLVDTTQDFAAQVEFDLEHTVRKLGDLTTQGLPSSYEVDEFCESLFDENTSVKETSADQSI